MARSDSIQLIGRNAARVVVRQLAFPRRLVNVGGVHVGGHDADLLQQLQAPRRGRGKHQRRRFRPRISLGPRRTYSGLLRSDGGHALARPLTCSGR